MWLALTATPQLIRNSSLTLVIRTLVTSQGGFEDLGLNTFDKLFLPGKAGEVVIGAVDHIDDGSAHLADGRSLPYDYLVLATGTIWEGPLTLPVDRAETHQWIADWRQKFANARNIAIIGGGACGIGESYIFHLHI